MSFKPRKYSAKKAADVISNMSEKCIICGKRNGHHSPIEARKCQEEINQPWSYSVEPDKMKKKMGFKP